jgi:hypothetical protein
LKNSVTAVYLPAPNVAEPVDFCAAPAPAPMLFIFKKDYYQKVF